MITDLWLLGDRALSALGNGLYQGVILCLGVWLGLKLARRANAATRYAVRFATLLVVAALPVLHFFLDDGGTRETKEAPADRTANAREPESASPSAPEGAPIRERTVTPRKVELTWQDGPLNGGSWVVLVPESGRAWEGAGDDPAVAAVQEDETALEPVAQMLPPPVRRAASSAYRSTEVRADAWAMIQESETAVAATSTLTSPSPSPLATESDPKAETDWGIWPIARWSSPLPRGLSLALIGVGAAIAALRVARLLAQCWTLRQLKRLGACASQDAEDLLETLGREMGVSRRVTLQVIPDLASPMAVGFWRPGILLPSQVAEGGPGDLERLLRHELAHVRRWDDWTNLAQQLIKAAYFFHPAVWWLTRRMTIDREIACDDHVLAATRAPRDYALFLTDFASRTRGRQWEAAPAAWSNPSQLTERIHMILDVKRNAAPGLAPLRAGALTGAVLALAALGVAGAPRIALGETTVEARTAAPAVAASPAAAGLPELPPAPTPPTPARAPTVVAVSAPPAPALAVITAPVAVTVEPGPVALVRAVPAPHPEPAPWPAPASKPVPVAQPRTKVIVSAQAGSVEERLARLERMIESLVNEGKRKGPDGRKDDGRKDDGKPGDGKPRDGKPPGPAFHFEHHFDNVPGGYHFEGLSQVLEQAAREVERATREAERAVKEAEKAAKGAFEFHGVLGDSPDKDPKRKALDEQRRSLQEQIGQMEGKLEALEHQLEMVDEHFEAVEEAREEAIEAREEALEAEKEAREEAIEAEKEAREEALEAEKERRREQIEKEREKQRAEADRAREQRDRAREERDRVREKEQRAREQNAQPAAAPKSPDKVKEGTVEDAGGPAKVEPTPKR